MPVTQFLAVCFVPFCFKRINYVIVLFGLSNYLFMSADFPLISFHYLVVLIFLNHFNLIQDFIEFYNKN